MSEKYGKSGRVLSEEEQDFVKFVEHDMPELLDKIKLFGRQTMIGGTSRDLAVAMTHFETGVMWLKKHIDTL